MLCLLEDLHLHQKICWTWTMALSILTLFSLSVITSVLSETELFTEGPSDKELKNSDTQDTWTVYDRSNFADSELCQVLNCRKRDFCLVKGEDAICLNRKQLKDAPGKKVFFRQLDNADTEEMQKGDPRRSNAHKQRHRSQTPNLDNEPTTRTPNKVSANNAAEWDPERVRQKLAAYYRSLKRKQRNRAAMARPNLYETPSTFKENDKTTAGGKKRCNEEQLRDIGVRLLQWFSDMQTHHDPVPSFNWRPHHRGIPCRNEPRWMFNQLDHDSDEVLDSDELYALTYDQYEPCVKPFLDRCDRNTDARLSIQEWCTCFHKVS